ncbi:MAG: maleylacetoacetate isomerase [Gemmobacter sp.]|uniref:maleylacetoacetate isomerase n=1 Tax=Gemmobacter sp. TaxID=1898957 RepID=UPI001A6479EC|nr:maleylacetoacetate isomerase [Gemmobacter sp.]MBL8561177.1 maleylacetoacetate isomerase [Gemmobacter sp.]
MSGVILHDYWRSSSAWRVRIGLNLAGVAYRRHPVDLLAGAQRDAAHLALNPQGLVPVLEIDGLRLTQSLAILDYLEETRGAGLLPSAPAARAAVRALAHAIAMDVQPVCNLRVARHAVSLGATMEGWMQHFIAPGLAAVEAMLPPEGAFCHGAAPGLAECCLVPQLYNARRWGVDLTAFPRLLAIEARCAALPAFAQAHAEALRPDPAP